MSLLSLFVNDKYKPTKTTGVSKVVADQIAREKAEAEKKKRAAQAKAWQTAMNPSAGVDPVTQSITDSATALYKHYQENGTLYPVNGGSGEEGWNSGDIGGTSYDAEAEAAAQEEAKYEAKRQEALKSIKNMKDSNISSGNKIKINKDDLWNKAASTEQKDAWLLKEEVFLYTFHDKERHKYLTSISIDCDKGDILGTAQIMFPYDQALMEYWIPGKTTFAIMGGTFDREILFIGRVAEVNQRGQEIEMVGHNIGWKFKPYMTAEFEKTLEKMSVKNAVKVIFQKLGFEKNGLYHIDLDGIPNIDKYVIGEGCSIEKDGQQIQNVPELKEVVENLGKYDIDKYTAKRSVTHETQEVARDHDEKTKMAALDRAINSGNSYTPAFLRQNYGVSTSIKDEDLLYEPILDKIQGKQDLKDFLSKGYSGDGDNTYEDVLSNIAAAIDAHFFIVDTTVCFMSFNALIANSSIVQKAVMPTIDFWQLQESSYELDINQYGYYNTVKIKYKNGTVTKSYEDLVRVFGEIPITYEEPKLDYEGAMLKAQAYLTAHIRDFGMELKATILYSGKITISNFIKLKNPLTMSESLFFIHGISVQWSADNQTLVCDLDLRFGPENPDGLEVPEAGTSYSNDGNGGTAPSSVSANISQAAQEITRGCTTFDQKALAIYNWVDQYVKYDFYNGHRYSSTEMLTRKMGNCWDTAYLIYDLCTAVGVKCEVWNGYYQFIDSSYGHLWNRIYYQGKMTFADTGYGSTGSIKRNPIGSYHGGHIISGSPVAKNY